MIQNYYEFPNTINIPITNITDLNIYLQIVPEI